MADKRISKKWLRLDPNDPQALTAHDIWFDTVNKLTDVVNRKLSVNAVIPVGRIGGLNYIPTKVTSEFGSPVFKPYNIAGLTEGDGTVVVLRPMWDGIRTRYLYSYNSIGDVDNLVDTEVEYRPAFLGTNEYVSRIISANKYGFFAEVRDQLIISTVKYYWINTSGTLDTTLHSYVDVTVPVNDRGYIALCKIATNRYIGCYLDGQSVKYHLLDESLNILTDIEVINVVNDIGYEQYEGFAVGTVEIYPNDYRPNLYVFENDDNTVTVVQHATLKATYGEFVFYGHIDLISDIDLSTNTHSLRFATPYVFNPNDPEQHPCYVSGLDYSAINFFPIEGGTAIYAIKDKFRCYFYKLTDDLRTAVENFANLPARFVEVVPKDVSYIGKDLNNVRWISNNKLLVNTQSNKDWDELQSIVTEVEFDSVIDRITIDGVSSLKSPVESYVTDKTNVANCQSTLIDTTGQWIGILQRADAILSVDLSTDNTSSLVPLPDNFDDQITAILMTDSEYASYGSVKYTYYYIGDNYFLVTYLLYTSSGSAKLKAVIVRLSGTVVSKISNFVDVSTVTILNADVENKTSGAIFSDIDSDRIYCVVLGPAYVTNDGIRHPVIATSFTKTSLALDTTFVTETDSTGYITQHTRFGPGLTEGQVNATRTLMYYADYESETDQNQRLRSCYNDWLSGLAALSRLYILTVKPPLGFKVYVPEVPVLMRSVTGVLEATQIDLKDYDPDPANKTFYLYIELRDLKPVPVLKTTRTPEQFSSFLFATITTDATGIAAIDVRHGTRLDVFTPSRTPLDHAIPISDENGVLDRRWFPQLTATDTLIYFDGFNTQYRDRNFSRIYQGVAELVYVDPRTYELTITFPEAFDNEPMIIVSPCDSSDGYTGTGSYSSLTSWFRLEAYNVSETQFSIRLKLGQDVTGGSFWVHWIAIGQKT